MTVSSHEYSTNGIGLSTVVDVFDNPTLFDELDNEAVLALSRLGDQAGFRDARAIRKSTGISTRRILRKGVTTLDVATALCERLQTKRNQSLSEFDHVLLCHSHTNPASCVELAEQLESALGLTNGTIRPFNFGCSGFLKLLSEASLLFDDGDQSKQVAVLSVETPEHWHDASDRLFCGIVSAGATAAVLESEHGLPLNVVRSDDFKVPAERRPNPNALFAKDSTDVFDFRGSPRRTTVMRMNAEPVFLNGIELMLDNLRSALVSIQREPGQRVVVAPHQPSGKLLKALIAAAQTELPDVEFLNNLEHYGNTISSSVPTLLSRLEEVFERNNLKPLRDGDHLILLAAGICMEEIQDHMSAGHACLTWQNGQLQTDRSLPQAVISEGVSLKA